MHNLLLVIPLVALPDRPGSALNAEGGNVQGIDNGEWR